jgi:hypothetical protein
MDKQTCVTVSRRTLETSDNESATDVGLSHVFVWRNNLLMVQKQVKEDAPDPYLKSGLNT